MDSNGQPAPAGSLWSSLKPNGLYYGNNPQASRPVKARDGTPLAVECYEAGPDRPWAVVVHSMLFSLPADCRDLIDALRPTHNVIVPTLRGHGRCALGASPISLRLLGEDLLEAARACTQEPVNLFCSCLSAPIGFLLAAGQPGRIARLAVVGGGSMSPHPEFGRIPYEKIRLYDPDFFAFAEQVMGGAGPVQQLIQRYAPIIETVRQNRSLFSRIPVPTLLGAPDRDRYLPLLASALEAYRYIRGARLLVWPGTLFPSARTNGYINASICEFFLNRIEGQP